MNNKLFLIGLVVLLAGCSHSLKAPHCNNQACLTKACSYESGYQWGLEGNKAYQICPFDLNEQYQKGHAAGLRQRTLEAQTRYQQREVRPN